MSTLNHGVPVALARSFWFLVMSSLASIAPRLSASPNRRRHARPCRPSSRRRPPRDPKQSFESNPPRPSNRSATSLISPSSTSARRRQRDRRRDLPRPPPLLCLSLCLSLCSTGLGEKGGALEREGETRKRSCAWGLVGRSTWQTRAVILLAMDENVLRMQVVGWRVLVFQNVGLKCTRITSCGIKCVYSSLQFVRGYTTVHCLGSFVCSDCRILSGFQCFKYRMCDMMPMFS
jgi:hypothetical protein